jgi:hypothetical protein
MVAYGRLIRQLAAMSKRFWPMASAKNTRLGDI